MKLLLPGAISVYLVFSYCIPENADGIEGRRIAAKRLPDERFGQAVWKS